MLLMKACAAALNEDEIRPFVLAQSLQGQQGLAETHAVRDAVVSSDLLVASCLAKFSLDSWHE